MSNQTKHKVTWFQRDERGNWQWQGFRDDLDNQEKVDAWLEEKQAEESEGAPEVFILDLEHANELLVGLMADSQQLADTQEWLEKVVQIDKITVEQDFNEFLKEKYDGEDESTVVDVDSDGSTVVKVVG